MDTKRDWRDKVKIWELRYLKETPIDRIRQELATGPEGVAPSWNTVNQVVEKFPLLTQAQVRQLPEALQERWRELQSEAEQQPKEAQIEQEPDEETLHKRQKRGLANPKLESVQILETDNLRFGLEVLVDNTNSGTDVWIKEILLGGRETQIQVGRTPFLVRAIFRVTMDCALREGVSIIAGRAEEDGADWAYRLQGTFKHINGTPKRTLEFSLSFKPVLTVPAGEKLPIVLIFKPATKKLVKIHRQGKSAGSYIGEFIEKRFWLEIHTNVGVLKYEMEDDSFLKFLASQGVELSLKP